MGQISFITEWEMAQMSRPKGKPEKEAQEGKADDGFSHQCCSTIPLFSPYAAVTSNPVDKGPLPRPSL